MMESPTSVMTVATKSESRRRNADSNFDEDDQEHVPVPRKKRKIVNSTFFAPISRGNSLESAQVVLDKMCKTERPSFKEVSGKNICLMYAKIFKRETADLLYGLLERSIDYDANSKVKVFGKLFDVPRMQTAYGDEGLSYTFSNVTVPARKWIPCLTYMKKYIEFCCQCEFNFVLVNRYENGQQYMGEHKDDEKDLAPGSPIASISLGQPRDFIFRHQDARGSKKTANYEPVKFVLEHGSLLVMKHPTNNYWYHSLPKRSISKVPLPRINLTFRKMVV